MKITLLSHTQDAIDLLLFTKSTRLNLSPDLYNEIQGWSTEKKSEELGYMADTIPSSWEFVSYTFLVEGVSRAYTHQQVRTRAASYAQQSMRVVNMADYRYVFTSRNLADPQAMAALIRANEDIKKTYSELIALGQPEEDARGILPTNISTNIICNFNLRTFSELAKSRTGGRTQSEYQNVINGMIDAVLYVHPWAENFLLKRERNYFDEIEKFAKEKFTDLRERGELLKIVDKMRKS